jgi:glutaredoxin
MILYIKSNCKTCELVKEYLDSINVSYIIVNIDNRIPASLIEQMNKPSFPETFDYPILVNDEGQIYFGVYILVNVF